MFGVSNWTNAQGWTKGVTILNKTGGKNTNGTDGLRVFLTKGGNIQVLYRGEHQFYAESGEGANDVNGGIFYKDYGRIIGLSTDNEIPVPSGSELTWGLPADAVEGNPRENGNVFAVGKEFYSTGSTGIYDGDKHGGTWKKFPTIVSATSTEVTAGTKWVVDLKYKAVFDGKDYFFYIKYTYEKPNKYLDIEYAVELPANHDTTKPVTITTGADVYFGGKDSGKGFKNKLLEGREIVGVRGSDCEYYMAYQNISGVYYSGVFAAGHLHLEENMNSNSVFNGKVKTSDHDTGIGASTTLYKAGEPVPTGKITSQSKLGFGCAAPCKAPKLSNTNITLTCANSPLDIVGLYTGTPIDTDEEFRVFDGNYNLIPSGKVTKAGTY